MITKSRKLEDITRVSHNEPTPTTPTTTPTTGDGTSGKWADVISDGIDSIAEMAGQIWGKQPVYNTTNNDNTDSKVTYIALGVGAVLLVVLLLVVLKK